MHDALHERDHRVSIAALLEGAHVVFEREERHDPLGVQHPGAEQHSHNADGGSGGATTLLKGRKVHAAHATSGGSRPNLHPSA